ncbi:PiggyBac transposable element-derived protein 3 [Portunus trituberculatus]|uniref:PiggyBac transposable element-derived protein 3 n=1 Tax=Portunus trituberculatus TaxID=210409 RepID=A0A5B7FV99_PORTR|nr:PiggyBac transposable element-derived protein 3 [Portunus trituberculatus]
MNSAVHADNYLTSIGLAEYLRSQYGCQYVGTAMENEMAFHPCRLKDMNKRSVPRGTIDYMSSDGILVARWKDNSVVTILANDVGMEPLGEIDWYDRRVKKKVTAPCPSVIAKYNSHMGDIDESDMLTHLYKTPFKAKRFCIHPRLDCMQCLNPLKEGLFGITVQIEVPQGVLSGHLSFKMLIIRGTRSSLGTQNVPLPRQGQQAILQSVKDATYLHMPMHVEMRQTYEFHSSKDNIHGSCWMCENCNVALFYCYKELFFFVL